MPDSPVPSEVSLHQEMALLIRMHQELLTLVGTLVEQNDRMLQQALDLMADDDDGEPRVYLDGTPVN